MNISNLGGQDFLVSGLQPRQESLNSYLSRLHREFGVLGIRTECADGQVSIWIPTGTIGSKLPDDSAFALLYEGWSLHFNSIASGDVMLETSVEDLIRLALRRYGWELSSPAAIAA